VREREQAAREREARQVEANKQIEACACALQLLAEMEMPTVARELVASFLPLLGEPTLAPGQAARVGPQAAPAVGPQAAPAVGPQAAPAVGPQAAPAVGPQEAPAVGPQAAPPTAGLDQAAPPTAALSTVPAAAPLQPGHYANSSKQPGDCCLLM
jgi:hypothetical protein